MPTLFLDAGALTAQLTLEEPVDQPDGQGGASRSWTAIADLWAKIEPVSAASFERASQTTETVTHRIYVRQRTGIAAGKRFAKGQRSFEIKTVRDPDESGRYLVCRCEETSP